MRVAIDAARHTLRATSIATCIATRIATWIATWIATCIATWIAIGTACAPLHSNSNPLLESHDIVVISSDASAVRPFEGPSGQLVAFVFISHECPIANAMAPDILAIAASARESGAQFYAVHPAVWVDNAMIGAHAKAFGYAPLTAVLHDDEQRITNAIGATMTPGAALVRLDGEGGFTLLYLGRVNDLYAAVGRRKANATSHDFADALDAARAGRTIPSTQPKAIGCFIELQQRSRS